MQSVEPRINNWPKFQKYYKKERTEELFDEPFALFLITPRLSLIKKELITTRVVVVGASECGLAFTDALTLG